MKPYAGPRDLLTLVAGAHDAPTERSTGEVVITFEELKALVRTGDVRRHVLHYRQARYLTRDISVVPLRMKASVALRVLSRGPCRLEDRGGHREPITPGFLLRVAAGWINDAATRRAALAQVSDEVDQLANQPPAPVVLDLSRRPLYLRTDLVFEVGAGGAVAHTAGVVNNLGAFAGPPLLVASARPAAIEPSIESIALPPEQRFCDFSEVARLHSNATVLAACRHLIATEPPAFIYQRYSTDSFAGVKLARASGVPLVLEYNGSEPWIARNWGKPLIHEDLCQRIEDLNLATANLVVVVSQALADELEGRGVDPAKILVNPNGVDVDVYRPDIDGSPVRRRLGLENRLVVGFIGSFGPWHGAEVLARAFVELVGTATNTSHDRFRLLMVGDGTTMGEVRSILDGGGVLDASALTGMVPQADGPAHLAACDVLVSPHVANRDGTPFFGSPTKLFEYMAMGRAVVASDLDQIGEVIEHGRTGLLVVPGDATALAGAILTLADDEGLRLRLGTEARNDAVARHTWRRHTERIVKALAERCG